MARTPRSAYRAVDGRGDGLPGISIDCYGPAAVLNVADDAAMDDDVVTALARVAIEVYGPDGVASVYVKPLAKDRSRLSDRVPAEARSPIPRAGVPQQEAITVDECQSRFEVRLYDGLSTGLFLEHREHRRALAARPPGRALNLFAYTCAFAVPLAAAGWDVTNVDVSARSLEWGRRNLALNGLETASVRFLRRDVMGYLAKAALRPGERYDLVILDPPTFGAANRQRGVRSWRATDDYPALVRAAVSVLAPGGVIFAATNTRALTRQGRLQRLIVEALGRTPRWLTLPPWPIDVTDHDRVAAVLFDPHR